MERPSPDLEGGAGSLYTAGMKITLSWNFDATETERALIAQWEEDIHARLDAPEFESLSASIEREDDGELSLQLIGPDDEVLVKAMKLLSHGPGEPVEG